MLKFYRKNIKLIIWLIVLSFIAWGVGTLSLSKGSALPYIGSVGREKISHKEFLTTFRYYDLLTHLENPKKETTQTPISFDELRALTWQVIALSRLAKQEGILVTDEEVRKEIEQNFSPNGQFDQALYQHWIQNGFKGRARDFEEAIRKQLIVRKMRDKVLQNVPEKERENRWIAWLGSNLSHVKITDYSLQKEAGQ